MKKERLAGTLSWQSQIALIIIPVITVIVVIAIGRMSISPIEAIKTILNHFGGNLTSARRRRR